jgi:hypothetical protein
MTKKQAAEKDIIIKALEQSLQVCNNCSPKPDGVISNLRVAIKKYEETHEAQAPKLPDEFYNCLPKGYVFQNEEPTISNIYDDDGEIYEGQCVITMLMKGEGEVIETPAPQPIGPVLTKELFNELIIAGRDMENRDRLGNIYLAPDDYYKQICERAPITEIKQ